MATVYGSVGQNTSKYSYYFTYGTSFNASTMKWTVTVKAYLVVKKYRYSGKTTYSVDIGDTRVASLASTTLTRGDNSSTLTYEMGSGSQTYDASTKDQKVSIVTKLNAPSGGYGPGSCSASTTITLPAKLSDSGKIVATDITPTGCTLNVSELGKDLGYAKECYFYYRIKGTEEWTRFAHVTVPDAETTCSTQVTGLVPGETYELDCDVYTPNPPDKMMAFFKTTVTFPSDDLSLKITGTTATSVDIEVMPIEQTVSTERTLKMYYKLASETDWVQQGEVVIHSNEEAGIIGKCFSDLLSNTEYDFKVELYYGTTLTDTATVSTMTSISQEYTVSGPFISNDDLVIIFTDNTGKNFVGEVSVYIRNERMPYHFVGKQEVDFTTDNPVEIRLPMGAVADLSSSLGEYPVKVIFHHDMDVEDIFQLTLVQE